MAQHRTSPDPTLTGFPPGVPYIIGNEAAERFSFYGMRAILTIFMTKYLVDATGNDATLGDADAKGVYHLFVAVTYFTPMIGAMIADIFWGKYKTILFISLLYCVGHGLLALMDIGPHLGAWDMEPFLYSGLFLIALGAGGIKPCVSAHVGDQFGSGNKRLMTQIFNWFYFSINVGAAASQLLTPLLLAEVGPWLAFGLPGVLMAIATFVFWLGRRVFVHIPPAGWTQWKQETFSPAGVRALKNLSPLFLLFVPMFWAIFDQTGSAWVLQADQMDRELGIVWRPSQIQFVNPVMILLGIPLFTYVVYPFLGRFFAVTPLRKIGIGLFLTAGSFAVSGLIEMPIQAKQAGIAQRLYADIAGDLSESPRPWETLLPEGVSAEDRERLRANAVRTVITAAEAAGMTAEGLAAVSGVPASRLAGAVPDDRAGDLLGDEAAEELFETLGISAEDAGGEPMAAALDAALAAGWDSETFAEAGLTFRVLARGIPDGPLAELAGAGFTGSVVASLAERTGEGGDLTASLADAVKVARTVWLSPTDAKPGRPDEARIVDGYLAEMPNIFWQLVAYLVLTSAEIMVSIVCLEFAYSQSPRKMKSFIMGVYFCGVALGNIFVSLVNLVISLIEGTTGANPLEGASYYWFFCLLMLATAIAFTIWAPFYKGETFIQGEDDSPPEPEKSEATAEASDAG